MNKIWVLAVFGIFVIAAWASGYTMSKAKIAHSCTFDNEFTYQDQTYLCAPLILDVPEFRVQAKPTSI